MATGVTFDPTTQTARKSFGCDHCRQPIRPGEQYERTRGIWEGTPGVFRSHLECRDCAHEIWKLLGCNWDEGVLLSADVEPEDHEWIAEKYPAVAERLGFTP